MVVWSAVTPSIKSREYCVNYIDNVSLTKWTQCLSPQRFSGKQYVFVLDLERGFAESHVKLQYFVTNLFLVRVCIGMCTSS